MRALAPILLASLALPAPAQDLPVCGPAATIAHREGAPVDRVELRNISDGPWRIVTAVVDLGPSAGRLVFDTRPGGAGINTAQPFRPAGGEGVLAEMPEIPDGATVMTLAFSAFAPGAAFRFTIDLDDRLSGRGGTTIETAEAAGGVFTVTFAHEDGGTETHDGSFDAFGRARAAAPCLS